MPRPLTLKLAIEDKPNPNKPFVHKSLIRDESGNVWRITYKAEVAPGVTTEALEQKLKELTKPLFENIASFYDKSTSDAYQARFDGKYFQMVNNLGTSKTHAIANFKGFKLFSELFTEAHQESIELKIMNRHRVKGLKAPRNDMNQCAYITALQILFANPVIRASMQQGSELKKRYDQYITSSEDVVTLEDLDATEQKELVETIKQLKIDTSYLDLSPDKIKESIKDYLVVQPTSEGQAPIKFDNIELSSFAVRIPEGGIDALHNGIESYDQQDNVHTQKGHYVAFVKEGDEYYLLDDQRTPEKQVITEKAFIAFTKHAYVLTYSKNN